MDMLNLQLPISHLSSSLYSRFESTNRGVHGSSSLGGREQVRCVLRPVRRVLTFFALFPVVFMSYATLEAFVRFPKPCGPSEYCFAVSAVSSSFKSVRLQVYPRRPQELGLLRAHMCPLDTSGVSNAVRLVYRSSTASTTTPPPMSTITTTSLTLTTTNYEITAEDHRNRHQFQR